MNCFICNTEANYYKTVRSLPSFKCPGCGLIWIVATEKDTAFYLSDEYLKADGKAVNEQWGYWDFIADEYIHRKVAGNIFRTVSKFVKLKGLKILELGCCCGFLIDEARKLGNQVQGVEINPKAIKYGREVLGLDINTDFDGTFDIAFLIGVLDHLRNPREMLEKVCKSCDWIVITVTDTAGFLPFYFLKPEHLTYFNHTNLTMLLRGMGFEVVLNRLYFTYYGINEFIYRFSKKLNLPNFSFKVPGNEMILVAKKMQGQRIFEK